MTVTQRKPQQLPEEVQILNEPEINITCDSCKRDLTHTVRIKCADPTYGIGNWKKIAEHIGTRTKEEVAEHYTKVYVESPNWPLPRMDLHFDVDPEEFQERKRRRITAMNEAQRPLPGPAPTSAPSVHEIAGFMPGRLEFEQEVDNEAENLVKDLEFGVVLQYGGDKIPEDENDPDVKARVKWEEEKLLGLHDGSMPPAPNGAINGHHINGIVKKEVKKSEDVTMANGEDEEDEPSQPVPFETQESLNFKLTLLEMYFQRLEKRLEAKALMFDRGLLEYKKIQANEKKRPKEEREFLHRLRPFAKLQTAADYEAFTTDMLYEAVLRKRIQELQHYRRLGLCTPADIEKYEVDLARRASREYVPDRRPHIDDSRKSREPTPRIPGSASGTGPPGRKQPAPLNLANSPCLHLLTPAEQALCSGLRIYPKPYLVVKEILVREYARRGGKLRRREARDLVKIDVNKTSRVWDFLVQAGYLKIGSDVAAAGGSQAGDPSRLSTPLPNGSPQKDAQNRISPRPSMAPPPAPTSSTTAPSSQFTFAVPMPPPAPPTSTNSWSS
ncbi:hypothetical protein NMY22_g13068 [Coprinellus aureogranulatus]|nr:hypothetical protein NMY22_g13068 [Coprinellus aureogranulatus]